MSEDTLKELNHLIPCHRDMRHEKRKAKSASETRRDITINVRRAEIAEKKTSFANM